ncbi:MAG: response regulator transcription factor [Zetaproteobacteria bacterium]|nr:response regulator transcription factor [Zetaproteobacteria bacterium]
MKNMESTVFLVDDDQAVRDALVLLMETAQFNTESFDSAEAFLGVCDPDRPGCLVLDVRMPGMSGIKLQEELAARGIVIPIIFLTGHADVSMSVQAFRSGAIDFMEKPFDENILLERIQEAIRLDLSNRKALDKQAKAESRLASLTPRENEIMWLIVAGKANKEIAAELDLSHRTVESHRGRIMEKTGARSLPDLVELTRASRGSGQD